MTEKDAVLLTPQMARQVFEMISQVPVPAGQWQKAAMLLSAVAAIAEEKSKVVAMEDTVAKDT